MADNGSPQTPKISCRQNASSFFTSLHLGCFVSKGNNDTESTMSSPTSILDAKPLSALIKPFRSDSTTPKTPKPESKSLWDSRGVGLGLLDALTDEKSGSNLLKPDSRMVLGSQWKIRLPPLLHPVNSSNESPKSPVDFGIKNKNSQVDSSSSGSSPSPVKKWSNSGALNSLSGSEMELSEDYTCVISHGPNPKTTHIFDDCILESCSGVVKLSESRKENGFFSNLWSMGYPSESFLSFCYTCKKNLGQGRDIYIYRGEKAFCSSDCRYKEMLLEEEMEETSDPDNVLSSSSQDPFHWLL